MPETPTTFSDGWEERMVELSSIDPSPFQVRTMLRGIEELAESIRLHGLLNPVLLRPKNGRVELVAGARRCKATAMLGQTSIRARIKSMSDEEALTTGLADNEHREETNLVEKATGYKMLLDPPFSHSCDEIGKEFGKHRSTIWETVQLLDQPEPIQELVASNRLSLSHARALRQLSDPSQRIELARQAAEHEWSVARVDARIKKRQTETEHVAENEAQAPASPPTLNEPKSPTDAAASIVEKLMDMSSVLSTEPKAAPAHANKPPAAFEGHLEKQVRALKNFVEKKVSLIPARAPFLRLALVGAVLAIATGYLADSVERPWLSVGLRALVGLFWFAVSALLLRYFILNRERLTTRVIHWIQLIGAINTGDVEATRAAARRFEPRSESDPNLNEKAPVPRGGPESKAPRSEQQAK